MIECLLTYHKIIQGETCKFKFILRNDTIVAQIYRLDRHTLVVHIGYGQSDVQAELTVCKLLCISMKLLQSVTIFDNKRLNLHANKSHISKIGSSAVPAKLDSPCIRSLPVLILHESYPVV